MSVPGTWTLNFDWGCGGTYLHTTLTLNANGTFATGDGGAGTWNSHDGQILFQYNNTLHTTYGGAVVDSAMVGISSTFGGFNGCWYAVKTSATTKALAEHKSKHDSAGNPGK